MTTLKVFKNVAEMTESTEILEGDTCKTLGYYKINDGGEGLYSIVKDDNLINDHGSVHYLNNGLKAILIVKNGTVNVKQFGAKGDDINDDTVAINNALSFSKKVIFTEGIYNIRRKLEIQANSNITGINAVIHSDTPGSIAFYGENVDNVSIEGFSFKCKEDGTDGLKHAVYIINSKNLSVKNCAISTRYFGIYIYGIDGFIIDSILFNQVRTKSYSNKDGIHINGNTHNGHISNILGTTDDDMIALNADEPNKKYGDITNITIDNVMTYNTQSFGLEKSTYRPIRLLSYGSVIDNIYIQNCILGSDYEECLLLSGDEHAQIKNVYINNCIFSKNTTRSKNIVKIETSYESLNIRDCEFFYNTTSDGAFISETNGYERERINIDNCKFVDKSANEHGHIVLRGKHSKETRVHNIDIAKTSYYQFLILNGQFENVEVDNINTKYPRYFVRVSDDANVKNLLLNNIICDNSVALVQVEGQLATLAINNCKTTKTTNVTNVEKRQENLEVSNSNVIASSIVTISQSRQPSNIRLISGVKASFIPTIAKTGDKFIHIAGQTAHIKLYTHNSWKEIKNNDKD